MTKEERESVSEGGGSIMFKRFLNSLKVFH